jgi:hypothetical protein
MRASTRAVRNTNRFGSQLANQMARDYGASLSYSGRKREAPERDSRISYYEGDTESEDEYQGLDPEDTIIVDEPCNKKRKVIDLDDDSDEDIPLANLPAVRDDGPMDDSPAGEIFRGFPTEVSATNFSGFRPTQVPLPFAQLGADGQL